MADPFALMNRTLERNKAASRGYNAAKPAVPGQRRKKLDPNNPADAEYLRRMYPDFDEVMVSGDIDYRTRCHTDANFASSFHIPPVIEATKVFAEHTNSVDAVCWGPVPNSFVTGSHDGTLKVWDAKSGRCTDTMQGHGGGVYHCAMTRDGKHIISCGTGESRSVLLWKWGTNKPCADFSKSHRKPVVHCTTSADCALAATSDQEGTICIQDLASSKCVLQRSVHLGVAHGSCFCPEDPNLLLSVGSDGTLQLLDLREAKLPRSCLLPSAAANMVQYNTTLSVLRAHDGYEAKAVEFVDRQMAFTVGADHKLRRWDMRAMPKCEAEYLGHTAPIRALALSPDQKFVVTGCEDGSCRMWAKDPLVNVRARLTELRAQMKEAEVDPGLAQKKATVRAAMSAARTAEEQLVRNGYNTAARTLHGHHGIIAGCAWRRDDVDKASILTASWDQTTRLYEVDLKDCV